MTKSPDFDAMQLDEFIASTLTQIVAGVRRAQEAVIAYGGVINPQVEGKSIAEVDPNTYTIRKNVEFDVAVTVTRSTGSGAGLKVAALGIGADIKGKSDLEHSAISRIKFSVLTVFPKQLPRLPGEEGFVGPVR